MASSILPCCNVGTGRHLGIRGALPFSPLGRNGSLALPNAVGTTLFNRRVAVIAMMLFAST